MMITYVAIDYDSTYTFSNLEEFKNFITDTQQKINEQQYNNFITYYNQTTEQQQNKKNDVRVYVTINGDNIYCTKYYFHIKEIIQKIKITQQLITQELITIINCNAWKYKITQIKEIENIIIYYTINENNKNDNNIQIHAYKNMVICYERNNQKPRIFNTNNYKILYKKELPT